MLSKTLRVGPLVMLELVTFAVGLILRWIFSQLCWSEALIQSSIVIFVLETLLAFHLIERCNKHRREHVCRLAASANSKLYAILAWNQLVLLSVIFLWVAALTNDAMQLTRQKLTSECPFRLYPLCLQYQSQISEENAVDTVQLWFLFAFYNFFCGVLLAMTQRKQFLFILNIVRNRRQLAQEYMESQSISNQIWHNQISQEKVINSEEFQIRECAICLSHMVPGEIVSRLSCQHGFHAACLAKWLSRKRQCPYRCPVLLQ